MPCSAQASRPPRNEFEEILRRPKLKRQWDARKLCSPALTVATAKVLEETAATAGEPALRVVAVVASEAGVPKVHLHLSRGKRSTVATGFSFPSPRPQTKCHRCNQSGHRHNECTPTIALNPNPSAGSTFGQGNTAMVALPPPPSCSAGPSASTSAMVTTYSSSPSGGQQHPQKFMACLP